MDKRSDMRLHNALDKILNREIKTRILRVLCKHNIGWTGRQLARELDVSPTTANKFLKELVSEGVVNIKGVGKSHLYSLNEKSYIVKKMLKPFFEKEKNILDTVASLIKKAISKTGVKVESVAIFGSIAQKKETSKSDIDLLVVINDLRDKKKIETGLDKIFLKIVQDFQTVISPYVLSSTQFKKRYREKLPVINEILKSHIFLMGKPLERLII